MQKQSHPGLLFFILAFVKALSVFLLILSGACGLSAQRAVVVTSVPANTPDGATLFLAGGPNGWDPAAPDWVFTPWEGGPHLLDVPADAPTSFPGKITRGSWATVEGNASGGFLPNRTFDFAEADTLYISVLTWEGTAPPPPDLPENLEVLDDAFFMPQLDRTRRVRVLLPGNYADEPALHYPVLYMHDGQNLFSAQESFAGEWEVDEAMAAFEAEGYPGALIVAVDNGGVHRIDEYTPYAHPQHGGGDGDAYAQFIAETLKPYVDEHYRTLPGREHTGIMGSSLGGLISFYTAVKYQEVFSKAGVFSPSFWFNSLIYDFAAAEGKQEEMRFFFLAGGQESAGLDAQVTDMVDVLGDAGFGTDEVRYDFVPEGQHSEWFWAQEFPEAFEWLFIEAALSTGAVADPNFDVTVFPNPADDAFSLRLPEGVQAASVTLFDQTGRTAAEFGPVTGRCDIGHLRAGLYFLRIEAEGNAAMKKLVKGIR